MKFKNFLWVFKRSKIYKVFSYFNDFKNNSSRYKLIFVVYALLIIISSLLLFSPWTQNKEFRGQSIEPISYIDALFQASSAFSDTGLVVVDSYKHWNIFGQALLAILILLGGIGVFALKLFVINWIFRVKNVNLSQINLINSERGSADVSATGKLVITSVKFLLIIILSFGTFLSIYFYFNGPSMTAGMQKFLNNEYVNPKGDWSMAFRFGFFHTISAINNAGFDIISGNSLMPYYLDYCLQICFIILLFIGGIGYPTIYDIHKFLVHKIAKKEGRYQFSLFTKVSLATYFIVLLGGIALTFIFELSNNSPYAFWNLKDNEGQFFYGNNFSKTFALIFSNFSTRSAGFATINMGDLAPGSILVFIVLMFIGAAPASTGGGIRTTTFAIVILTVWAKIIKKPNIRVFWRQIKNETQVAALQVFIISVILLFIITLICTSSFDIYRGEIRSGYNIDALDKFKFDPSKDIVAIKPYTIEHIIFEVSSAFGTTGLSTGITKDLNVASKIAITILMFIGQFGISSTLLVWSKKHNYSNHYKYISSDIAIG
ncbi:potassium transporter TrkG [Mycoplasmopsis ciconiae]|uniref:Potassium transporter TrkG n=1 Tax=Mycoplasmopsis ciconiae TaxID=561067 RepID=A0ABU7MKU2_9BACT|nr:potassium transporter TrkG [Mycoplasmopsis ciconiae]